MKTALETKQMDVELNAASPLAPKEEPENQRPLELCNGRIQSNGICERCFQVSMTSSAQCTRYTPAHPELSDEDIERWADEEIGLIKADMNLGGMIVKSAYRDGFIQGAKFARKKLTGK